MPKPNVLFQPAARNLARIAAGAPLLLGEIRVSSWESYSANRPCQPNWENLAGKALRLSVRHHTIFVMNQGAEGSQEGRALPK
jgi:hypothetical protein